MSNLEIDFIGIGAQKSATSWIYECLMKHPDISGYEGKETHFFSNENIFSKGLKYYEKFFSKKKADEIIGEYSASYLSDKNSASRIKKSYPNVKLIVSLRNPVKRAYSHYLHLKSKGVVNNESFIEAMEKHPEIIKNGEYGKHLSRYLEVFPRKQIFVVMFDDLKENPKNVIRKIYKFLGVDSTFVPNIIKKKYNESKVRRLIIYKKINQLYFFLKNRSLGKILIKFLKALKIDFDFINGLASAFSRKSKNSIKESEEEFLKKCYEKDLGILEDVLDLDLSAWYK